MTATHTSHLPTVPTKEEREAMRRKKVANSFSYKLTKFIAKWMDAYFLDPIIGFFLPAYGDIITAVFNLPFLYISIFKLRSFTITLGIILNTIIDLLVGMIPGAGDVLDIFVKSYTKNAQLLIEHVEYGRKVDLKFMLSNIARILTFQNRTIGQVEGKEKTEEKTEDK